MTEYGVIVGLSVIIYGLMNGLRWKSEKVNKVVVAFFFIAYFVLLALRDIAVGVDTTGYVNTFNNMSRMTWEEAMLVGNEFEKGFTIFLKLMSDLGDERLLLFVAAALIVFPVMYLYMHEAKDALFCISFFLVSLLFEMFFSGMRQSIAIACGVPAFYFVKKKKIVPFILTVLLAISFHTSGVLLAALYPIYHAHITKKWLIFVIPLFGIIYVIKDSLVAYIFIMAGDQYTRGYSYLNDQSGQVSLMVLFIVLSAYSYFMLDEKRADREDFGCRNILLLAAFIHLFTPINPVFSRLNYYFILFIPLAITRANAKCLLGMETIAKLANVVMSAFFILYFFLLKADSLNIFEYQFFF